MNNLKNTILVLVLLFTVSCVFGQKNEEKSKRVFSLNMYQSIVYAGGATSATNTFGLGSFTPAVRWGIEKEDFHEIEIPSLYLTTKNSSFYTGIGVKYSYNWKVLDSKISKTEFYFGTGIEPLTNFSRNYSSSTTAFSIFNSNVDVNLSIAARMKWNVSDKFFVNLSVPYNYYTFSYFYENNENPILPRQQGQYSSTSSKVFPNDFTVKVGVGINF